MKEIIFLISAGLIIYTYFGYPLLLFITGLIFKKPVNKKDYCPRVSVILSIFNEEDVIPQLTYAKSKRAFQAGEIAMTGTSIMILDSWEPNYKWLKVGLNTNFGEKPRRLPVGGASLVVLARDDDQKNASWEFLKFLSTKESMDIWTRTGYISPLKIPSPLQDPRQKAAYDQLSDVVQRVNWPGENGLEADGIFSNYRDMIIYGKISVEEGLQKAVQEINDLIK